VAVRRKQEERAHFPVRLLARPAHLARNAPDRSSPQRPPSATPSQLVSSAVSSMLPIPFLLCLAALLPSPSSAADAPSCVVSVPGSSKTYDLSSFSDLKTIESTQITPPTETTHRVRMKICGGEGEGLGKEEGVDDEDQASGMSSLHSSHVVVRDSAKLAASTDTILPPP
jgi:hypothetical protein